MRVVRNAQGRQAQVWLYDALTGKVLFRETRVRRKAGDPESVAAMQVVELEIFFERNLDIWTARRSQTWQAPVAVSEINGTTTIEKDAALTADGLVIVFSSDRPLGDASMDLWLARKPQPTGSWVVPVVLASLASSSTETAPWIDATATLMLFYSNRPEGQGAVISG